MMLSFTSLGDSTIIAKNQAGLIIVPLEERRIVKEWRWTREKERDEKEREKNGEKEKLLILNVVQENKNITLLFYSLFITTSSTFPLLFALTKTDEKKDSLIS